MYKYILSFIFILIFSSCNSNTPAPSPTNNELAGTTKDWDIKILLDGLERAKSGRGQAFSIVAKAGAGKSRLLYEFRKSIINEDVTFLEGKCLSYSKGTAYHPIIDVLKADFDISEGDADSQIRQKVKMRCLMPVQISK